MKLTEPNGVSGRRWATAPGERSSCASPKVRNRWAARRILPVSRSAVSQHLKVLKDAGLVAEQAVGTKRIYRVNEAGVLALRDQLDTFWNRALRGSEDVE